MGVREMALFALDERKGKKEGIRLNKAFVQYKWTFLRLLIEIHSLQKCTS
jgi:hypothetical protein